jgi:AccI restriction endonuclease
MARRAENNAYFQRVQATRENVIRVLERCGIDARHLGFGGEGALPKRKPTVPTDARSEFLANRAMGDWAEKMCSDALARAFRDWHVVQYGDTGRIAASEPGFREMYTAGLEGTRRFGKRPDLLVFPEEFTPPDLSLHGDEKTDDAVRRAIAAAEVRSSKFEALTYMAFRKKQRDSGNKSARETPSFTVKVEDLVIVYRWLERYGVPQSYCQVFFDSIFGINFLGIFEIIASNSDFTIEEPAKSQQKATIMIPITRGVQIGSAIEMPSFAAEHRVTQLGRHDAYVVPKGGGFKIDRERACQVLVPER